MPGPEEPEQAPPSPDYVPATPPPHPAYRTIARISIPAPVPMPAWTDSETRGYLTISKEVRLRDEAASTSSPPLQLPSSSHREDRPEVTLPPQKRLDITLGPSTRDRHAHAYTRQLMETEVRMSREAWVRATDTSGLVYGEVMSLRTTVLDHRRSTEISELRTALQGQVTALQGHVTALQA
nr:hypothetical protein [Tanacetum cinerariifolium]